MKLGEKWQERKTKRMCDAPIMGVPLTTVNLRKTCVPHTPYMSNNGHLGPIHPYSSEIINYIFIVSMPVLQKDLYMFTKIFTQSHISAFFSKVASSECRLPGYSLYLKGGSHDFPTRVTPHLKCICNGIYKQSITFHTIMLYYMKCLYHA